MQVIPIFLFFSIFMTLALVFGTCFGHI